AADEEFRHELPLLTRCRFSERYWIHLDAGANFHHPVHDYALSGSQALVDHPQRADPVADLHVLDRDFVVGVDDRDLIIALQLAHSALRHQQSVLLYSHHCPNFGVLARPQNISWIGELTGQKNGSRALVDLTIGEKKSARMRMRRPIGQNQLELKAAQFIHTSRELEVLLFTDRKLGLDRFKR